MQPKPNSTSANNDENLLSYICFTETPWLGKLQDTHKNIKDIQTLDYYAGFDF